MLPGEFLDLPPGVGRSARGQPNVDHGLRARAECRQDAMRISQTQSQRRLLISHFISNARLSRPSAFQSVRVAATGDNFSPLPGDLIKQDTGGYSRIQRADVPALADRNAI